MVRRHQLLERGYQELLAVDEAQLPEGEGDILLHVVRDTACHPPPSRWSASGGGSHSPADCGTPRGWCFFFFWGGGGGLTVA